MADFVPSVLTDQHKDHCLAKALYWMADTKLKDRHGWRGAEQHVGHPPHMWEYMHHRLIHFLDSRTRSPGQAAWAWKTSGTLYFGYIYSDGTSEGQQSSPLQAVESWNQWWPVIFLVPYGTSPSDIHALFPMYCPVLAQNFSRPWFAHRSRLFNFDVQWLWELEGLAQAAAQAIAHPVIVQVNITVQDTGPSDDPSEPSHHVSTVTDSAGLVNGYNIVPDTQLNDIANLDDVASEIGCWSEPEVVHPQAASSGGPMPGGLAGVSAQSSHGSSPGSSSASYNVYASSDATTTASLQETSNRGRWGKQKKVDK